MTIKKFFGCVVGAPMLCAIFASSQNLSTQSPDVQAAANVRTESVPTFHSTSNMVVVDVVVTDHDGKPISGLDRDDFTLLEDGKPQHLQAFETHLPAKQPAALPSINLPTGEYTNFPTQVSNSAVNVVLFDILNTPTDDQMFARQQMIGFLKTLPRGQRVALFTLGYDLRMVAGFTTSTDELIAAAKKLRPGVSPLLDTEKDTEEEESSLGVESVPLPAGDNSGGPLGSGGSGVNAPAGPTGGPTGLRQATPSDAPSMAALMSDFLTEARLVRTDIRVEKTFEAMGALARALSGYSGRKNLLWLSEAFPGTILPTRTDLHQHERNYLGIFQQYSGLLESSQISVYPIDPRGLEDNSLPPAGGGPEPHSLSRAHMDMAGSQLTMRDVAEQTGGEAFYNSNDLKTAMKRSMEHGSTYYTLGYVPLNQKWDGGFRHIAVKLSRPGLKPDYRQGYYAIPNEPSPANAAHRMLVAEMQPGVPQSTMLLLRVKVTPPSDKNAKVSIDYGVYASDLTFTGDEQKHAKLEFVAVAWDKDNKAAGDVSETMDLNVKPETFQRMLNTGVPAHQELALKQGSYKLRLGVMDYSNNKIGTLEVPIIVGANQPIASKN
jgi:VWFA-related protein